MKLTLSAVIDDSLSQTIYELKYTSAEDVESFCARIEEKGKSLLEALTRTDDSSQVLAELYACHRALRECPVETEGLERLLAIVNACLDVHEAGQPQFGVFDNESEVSYVYSHIPFSG